jgi:hypothetical protein
VAPFRPQPPRQTVRGERSDVRSSWHPATPEPRMTDPWGRSGTRRRQVTNARPSKAIPNPMPARVPVGCASSIWQEKGYSNAIFRTQALSHAGPGSSSAHALQGVRPDSRRTWEPSRPQGRAGLRRRASPRRRSGRGPSSRSQGPVPDGTHRAPHLKFLFSVDRIVREGGDHSSRRRSRKRPVASTLGSKLRSLSSLPEATREL